MGALGSGAKEGGMLGIIDVIGGRGWRKGIGSDPRFGKKSIENAAAGIGAGGDGYGGA